ncbi:hypothetical protein GC163_19580 [bacterium]|nr:hypothetical protein [bacterium]
MAKCAACGTMILFGGETQNGRRYCNSKCLQNDHLQNVVDQLPPELLEAAVAEFHQSECPQCGGEGPIDIHTSHRAWSAVVMTTWSSHPVLCCRSCAFNNKLKSIAFTGVLGWWGFPWGFIATPIQVSRNIFGFFSGPDPDNPSVELQDHVAQNLALQMQRAAKDRKLAKAVEPVFDEADEDYDDEAVE